MQAKRHLGKLVNTDQRVVVVFMQIPNRETHALIVGIDSLSPRFEHALMQVVESPEGQGNPDLGTVIGRRMMPDTNITILQALHNTGMLVAVPVDNVVMLPFPNRPFPLRQVLESMGRVIAPSVQQNYAEAALIAEELAAPTELPIMTEEAPAPVERFNPHVANQQAGAADEKVAVARNLLFEAEDLEAVAKAKREQAYSFAPSLRPAPPAPAPAPVAATAPAPAKTRRGAEAPKRTNSRKKAQG